MAVIADSSIRPLLLKMILHVVVLCAHHSLVAGHSFGLWDPLLVLKILHDLGLVVQEPLVRVIVGDAREQGLVIRHHDCVICIHLADTDSYVCVQEALVVLLLPLFVFLKSLGVLQRLCVAVECLLGVESLCTMQLGLH